MVVRALVTQSKRYTAAWPITSAINVSRVRVASLAETELYFPPSPTSPPTGPSHSGEYGLLKANWLPDDDFSTSAWTPPRKLAGVSRFAVTL